MKITVFFVLTLLIIGIVGVQSYLGIQRLTEANRWVIHTYEVQGRLDHMLSALKDAETGGRGFVLTGEDRYLEPFNAAVEEIQGNIKAVESLTQDNPEQQKNLQQLRNLTRDKLVVLQETIKLRRKAGMEAALSVIRTDRGEQIMDEIRAIMNQMESHESGLLDKRNRVTSEAAQRSILTVGIGMLLSLIVLGVAAVIVRGRKQFGVKVTAFFVLTLLMIGIVGVQSYLGIQRLTEANRWVIHTYEVQGYLEHVLSALKDAETGGRGFVLTGEDRYLEPFNAAVGEIQGNIKAVESLTQDNPEQQKNLQQLRNLTRDKLVVLQETIKLRRKAGMEAALSVIRTDRGEQIMDEIRALMNQMESRESGLLDKRNRVTRETAQRSILTVGIGMLLSLIVLGAFSLIIMRTMMLADRSLMFKDSSEKWIGVAGQYTFAVAAVALAMCFRLWLVRSFGPMPLFITSYPAILVVATIAGGGPGVVVTILSALATDYWFIEPIGHFSITAANNGLALGIFTGTGIFLSVLAERLKRARRAEAVSVTQKKELALLNMGNLMALDLDHRIVRWSEGNRRLYGFDSQEAQGQLTYELLQTHFGQPQEQIHSELLEKGYWEGEITRRSKDGAQLSVAILWALRRDERGKPLAILEVSTDITRQKLAEESLRQQSEELAQQNEELSQQSEELAQQSEELSEQNEELQTQSEKIQALNADLIQWEKMLQTLLDSARLPIGEAEVIGNICQTAREMIGRPATGVVVCELHGDELKILAHAGFDGDDVPGSWPAKGSFPEMVIQQDRTASLEDTSLRTDLNILSVPGHLRFAAVLSSPLRVKGKPIGAVSIYSSKKQQWTEEQFRLIEWLAAQCSHTLEAMRLAAEVLQSQKQNEFLANILEASSQAFGVGYPDGRLGLTNKAFEKLTGYSSEELRSLDWSKTLTPPEWIEIEQQKLDELSRTGLPVRYEKEYIRKDGTRVTIELLVHVTKDTVGKPLYYYSFLTDITERKRAEEVLRLSEEKFATAFANNSAAIAMTRLEDGLFLEVNNTWLAVNGYSRDEVIGHSARKLHIWPSAEAANHFVQTLREKGAVRGWEQEFRKKSGELFVAQLSAQILFVQGERVILSTLVDITDRKRAEEALQQSEARFRTLFETMTEGFSHDEIILDEAGKPVDLRYLVVNPAFERHTGLKAENIVGRTTRELFPDAEPVWFERYGKVVLTGEPAHFEERFGPLNKWFEVSVYRTDTNRFAVVFFDISERKKAEENILKLNKDMAARNLELELANKEMESFVYSVSHDLRAPLRIMSGFSKILIEDYANKLENQPKDYLLRITKASERMTELIEDLLRLSQISKQNMDRMDYDLSSLASSIATTLRETEPDRSVDIVITEGMRASVDPNLIRIALMNLIDNAWKFTSKTTNARIEFNAYEKDGKTVYYVRDNGAGFDRTYADKMFLPFHRLHSDKEFGGTGIGLAIVERIIHRHEGKICAEGDVGIGATLYFTLG